MQNWNPNNPKATSISIKNSSQPNSLSSSNLFSGLQGGIFGSPSFSPTSLLQKNHSKSVSGNLKDHFPLAASNPTHASDMGGPSGSNANAKSLKGGGDKSNNSAVLSEHTIEEQKMMAEIAKLNSLSIRCQKFKGLLEQPNVDFDQLRKLAWPGIPDEIRPTVWKLLMGYLPANSDRRESTLARKRAEYQDFLAQSWGRGDDNRDPALYHQIHIDIQRTNANIVLYQRPKTQEILERILYIWAIRHPASGYVQGINDLLTPFYQVFLMEFNNIGVEECDPSLLSQEILDGIEADSYWCLTKLLDGIQDNYIHKQPGITRQIARLKELVSRVDAPLAQHLQSQGVEFIQFAFRWMNCLLMREISLKITIRMWDSYQSDGPDGFQEFHLYVCTAFLIKWSGQLKKMEFSDIMILLQSLPTQNWTEKEVEMLLSEAFMLKSLFHGSQAHLIKSS